MDARRLNLGGLFELSIRLKAPLFQRPYVWKRERNWEPLWESIAEVARRRLERRPERPHFLGAAVFEQLPVPTGQIGDVRQIIDGQQRLTTLQIALAAARDEARALNETFFADDFRLLTQNHTTNETERLKVEPTTVDIKPFADVMSAGSVAALRESFGAEESTGEIGHLLADCYLYFREAIAEWISASSGNGSAERWAALSGALRSGLQLVVIDLDPGKDDAQEIFETLNYRGEPLLPVDLVKNYLFRRLEAEAPDAAPHTIYDKFWRPFDVDGSFWREEVRQGRLKTPRVNVFLQHYLTLRTADEVLSTNIFGVFRDHAKSLSAQANFEALSLYASVFDRLNKPPRGTREDQFLRRLDELDVSTFHPLLLEVFRPGSGLSPEEVDQIMLDVESYLVRRVVCNLTTKGYNRLVVDLIAELRKQERISAASIREFLLKQTADSAFWPPDDEFATAWREQKAYWFKKSKVRMILEAIDAELQDAKTEKVKYAEYGEKLTIEHLLPQNWKEHWPLPPQTGEESPADRRERVLHTLGNLTLLNGKLNPAVGNGPWPTKRNAIWEHSKINLNRQLLKFEHWNEARIRERADSLLRIAIGLWPRPRDERASKRARSEHQAALAEHATLPWTGPAKTRLVEIAFFDVLATSAGKDLADLARTITSSVRAAGLSFRPHEGSAVIRVRLTNPRRRVTVCHIETDGRIRFGWTRRQLEEFDLPVETVDNFYLRVANAFGVKSKSNGVPVGLSLARLADKPDAFVKLVVDFADEVTRAAGSPMGQFEDSVEDEEPVVGDDDDED